MHSRATDSNKPLQSEWVRIRRSSVPRNSLFYICRGYFRHPRSHQPECKYIQIRDTEKCENKEEISRRQEVREGRGCYPPQQPKRASARGDPRVLHTTQLWSPSCLPPPPSSMAEHAGQPHDASAAEPGAYSPKPSLQYASAVALQAAGIGAFVSAVQNALGSHTRGALGFLTRSGGTIGVFGVSWPLLCSKADAL